MEPPAFAAIGLTREVEAIAVEKLVGASLGFAKRQAASESGAVVRDIRVLPFIEVTCIPNSTLKRLESTSF